MISDTESTSSPEDPIPTTMPPPPGSGETEIHPGSEERPLTEGLVLIARGIGTILDAFLLYVRKDPEFLRAITQVIMATVRTKPTTSAPNDHPDSSD